MKVIAIIQARMESTRLPGKVLKNISGKPALWHIVRRALRSRLLDNIIIATSENIADYPIYQFACDNGMEVFRGSQSNVLERFYKCAVQYKPDIVVRLTGDNVLIDSALIDAGIECFLRQKDLDYMYYREGLPLGMAVEVFTYQALQAAYSEANEPECLEHVTPYLYRNSKFHTKRISSIGEDYSYLRWTLDTQCDYELITKIYKILYKNENSIFGMEDVLEQYQSHKEWEKINSDVEQVKVTYQGDKKV